MMLAVSFKKSMGGSKGRTMTVVYDDMSLKHLDKNVVLLKNQHLTNESLAPCTIVLGVDFKPNRKGILTRWHGGWKPEGVSVLYDIRDLAIGIRAHGVPISSRFFGFLSQFTAYSHGGGDETCQIASFLRNETGGLRGIIENVSGLLGVVPFWNTSGECGAEGCLDYIILKDDIDKTIVEAAVAKYANSCNIEDDSSEVTIKNSFLQGGIGSFSVNPDRLMGAKTKFKRITFQEHVFSPYTDARIKIKGSGDDQYELSLLMRAAVLGATFYRNYVLQKLTASYAKDLIDEQFDALESRDQGNGKFSFVDIPVWEEGGKRYPFNITTRQSGGGSVVDKLYKSGAFEMVPSVYSKNISWRGRYNVLNELGIAGQIALDKGGKQLGTDSKYYTLLDDLNFMGELRGSDGGGAKPDSEFIGTLVDASSKALLAFIESPGSDPIYSQMAFLAEHFGRWYCGKNLITAKIFNARRYFLDVQAYFSDLAITDTPLSPIWNRYRKRGGEDEDKLWEKATYSLNWGGTAECGYKMLPANTITLPDRKMEVEDAYKNIISIHTYVRNFNPNANPRKTKCRDISRETEVPTSTTITGGSYGRFVYETYSIRTDRDLKLTESCKATGGKFCVQIKTQTFGLAASITSDQYATVNSRRQDCDRPDNWSMSPTNKCNPSSQKIVFVLPTDNDAMVLIHDIGKEYEVADPDTAMATTVADPPNSFTNEDSYWGDDDFLVGLESVNEPVKRGFKTSWGKKDLDYWDLQLMTQVMPSLDLREVKDNKNENYSYRFVELLQGLRCAVIPSTDYDKVSKIMVENISFDISQLLSVIPYPLEYEICEDKEYLNLQEAEGNLITIMKNYVEANTSPSISRDFVVSGFGFKDSLDGTPQLPSVYEGLESLSVAISENGIHTTVKMGNRRRSRFSAQLQSEMIVKSLAGSPSASRIPNYVAGSFGVGIQTRM
tara:strand:- start:327 stop:3173 length:2847 start_codon:yes stop_codon:yes gene_type:complete